MFIGGVGGFVPVALIPFSMFLKGEYLVFAFLSIVLSSTKIFLSLMSVEIMIAVNRTVDISHRGTMQGFCSLGGSIAKAAGPVFGGKYIQDTDTLISRFILLICFPLAKHRCLGFLLLPFFSTETWRHYHIHCSCNHWIFSNRINQLS